ncbi:hypothetical protein DFP72DRAFT_935971 [Ephemerocybe angulata]|uniref:BTB domain-containing protein n=1 Tax=Ephemerocybe angulata TaxID=980116 RepID=A0A8H6LT86_9AGAR|nr:hypothetical protein DFP72DRAFT_935971 [Tulosesus angulatus]
MSEGAQAQLGGGRDAACPVPNCPIPVDLILRSSDKVLLGAHKANLEHFSDGFPSVDSVSDSEEPVDLSEDGATLKLLLSGMHKQKLPALTGLEREQLVALAEAGEKYFVYGVMAACSERIRAESRMPWDGATAATYFAYAMKFGYLEIADTVAPFMIPFNVDFLCGRLKGYDVAFIAWIRYREQYVAISDILTRNYTARDLFDSVNFVPCSAWAPYLTGIRKRLPMSVQGHLQLLNGAKFDRLEWIFKDHQYLLKECTCERCSSAACRWKERWQEASWDIKPFSSFM